MLGNNCKNGLFWVTAVVATLGCVTAKSAKRTREAASRADRDWVLKGSVGLVHYGKGFSVSNLHKNQGHLVV